MSLHAPVIIEPDTNYPCGDKPCPGSSGGAGAGGKPGFGQDFVSQFKKGGSVKKTAKKAVKATKAAKVVKTTAKKTASKLKKSKGR